jgi:hypothetical protein
VLGVELLQGDMYGTGEVEFLILLVGEDLDELRASLE